MERTRTGADSQEGGQEMKITMVHMRQVRGFAAKPGFCRRGIRTWFTQRGLDFDDFLKNGVDEEVLLASKDPLAIAVVEQAHGKQ